MSNHPTSSPHPFPYHCIRRITCPDNDTNGRQVYSGYAPAESFLGLPTSDDVREYLLEAEGRKRRKPTQVHQAMRDTLENAPQDFCILNGGIVIVARDADVDDKNRTAKLKGASIINGAQTQGEVRRYVERKAGEGETPYPVHVAYELIVTDADDLIAEVSIARNFQNDVMTISIAGRRGQLDELENAFRAKLPKAKLRKSETKLSEDYVFTEKLVQVITSLIPAELWPKDAERNSPNKVYAYNMKTKCLKDFQQVWRVAHEQEKVEEKKQRLYQELYQFYLDIAAEAWTLYEKWKSHSGFEGTYLRAIKRHKGKITEVPDGIVFPILAALSAFAVKKDGHWTIRPPASFDDAELIQTAKQVYMDIAGSKPMNMGKSKACYTALYQITSLYRRLSKSG